MVVDVHDDITFKLDKIIKTPTKVLIMINYADRR